MEKRYRLELIGITYNQIESGVYALILQQVDGTRRIPIIIGFPEAQAIECKLQEVATPRPLTHDLMGSMMGAFGISLLEVEIRKLPNGVFGAWLTLSDGKTERRLDSRSSDAVALAIRVGAPIYTSESVLLESGFEPNEGKNKDKTPGKRQPPKFNKTDDLSSLTLSQLNDAMQKAAEDENYEEAAKIKAEIDRRNPQNEQS